MRRLKMWPSAYRMLRAWVIVGALAAATVGVVSGPASPASAAKHHTKHHRQKSLSAHAGLAYAVKEVDSYSKNPPQFKKPGPAVVGAKSALRGKKVWFIPLLLSIPNFGVIGTGLSDALSNVGATVVKCTGKANATGVTDCIDQAIQEGAGGIVTDGYPVSLAPTAFSQAKQAHIPVVVMDEPSTNQSDAMAFVPSHETQQQALAAETIIAQSKGKAHVVIAEADDNTQSIAWVQQGAVPTFKKYCPRCHVTVMPFNSTTLQTQVPSLVSTTLLNHPGTDYILSEFDTYIPAIIQGIQAAHVSGIDITGTTGILSGLQRIASGSYETMDVGTNFNEFGWLGADQLIRMAAGAKPATYQIGLKVFSAKNVQKLQLTLSTQNNGAWYGSTGYETTLKKLWK